MSEMVTVNLDKSDRVFYIQFKDTNPEFMEPIACFKYFVMWIKHTLLMHGTSDGIIIVMNSDGLSWRHIIKLPIGLTAKMCKFLEVGTPKKTCR